MTVSGQIIEVLNALCEKFGLIIDWSSENVLPYLQELCGKFINYEIATSVVWIVIWFCVCVISWIVWGATYKTAEALDWDSGYIVCGINVFFLVFALLFSVIFILVASTQIFDIIEAIYLPEKTIYEFIRYQISLH